MTKLKKNNILVAIVLYKIELYESITYNSFIKNTDHLKLDYELLIFNNSSDLIIEDISNHLIVNSTSNEKLSGAYNYALNYATAHQKDWLLLLDQDTEITGEYLSKLSDYLNGSHIEPDTVAIVPFLSENNKILSPRKVSAIGWWQHDIKDAGIQRGHVSAFNSLSLLWVDFILSIGGFSTEFPLDMLDHWYYFQMYKNEKNVYVLDTVIQHQLSVSDYEQNVSLSRHHDLLQAEKAFAKSLGLTHYFTYKVRLFLRMSKHLLTFEDKRYAKVIFKIFFKKS